MIKPGYEQPIDSKTLEATRVFFEKLLKIIHPFTPFIAEEIWHLIREREEGNDIIVASWPTTGEINCSVLANFKVAEEVIIHIRNTRKKNNVANKLKMDLFVKKNNEIDTTFDSVISKMGNLSSLEYVTEKVGNSNSFIVNSNEYYIPFGENIDLEAEKEKMKEELNYTKGFLQSVLKKLQNEKFVAGAPEQVLTMERKKESDAISKIKILEEKLSSMN
jgi:valyl-tRNA synthetase